jgi:hypothetical protein
MGTSKPNFGSYVTNARWRSASEVELSWAKNAFPRRRKRSVALSIALFAGSTAMPKRVINLNQQVSVRCFKVSMNHLMPGNHGCLPTEPPNVFRPQQLHEAHFETTLARWLRGAQCEHWTKTIASVATNSLFKHPQQRCGIGQPAMKRVLKGIFKLIAIDSCAAASKCVGDPRNIEKAVNCRLDRGLSDTPSHTCDSRGAWSGAPQPGLARFTTSA